LYKDGKSCRKLVNSPENLGTCL